MNLKIKLSIFTLILFFSLSLADRAFATNNVYYSVGQNTGDLSIGTGGSACSSGGACTVNIVSGTATINVGQSAPNIGVGDYLEYGTAPYQKAYVVSKNSAAGTVWSVVTATGATPADTGSAVALNSIKHTFSTLNGAVAAASGANYINNASLVAADVVLNIPCYYDSAADTTAVTVSGYTTDATRYIRIYTPQNATAYPAEANYSQRHQGKYDLGKYRLETSEATAINASGTNFLRIDGLEISVTAANNTGRNGIAIKGINAGDTTDIQVSNNIVSCNFSSSATNNFGIISYWGVTSANTFKVWNNIVYGAKNGNASIGGISFAGGHIYAYNNTVANNYLGFNYSSPADVYVLKNNLSYNNTMDYSSGGSGYDASSANNLSKDSSSPNKGATDCGGHYCTGQTLTFADSANKDFHLGVGDTAARASGINLGTGSTEPNLKFDVDINGHTRPAAWDIGADQGATHIFYSVGQNTTDHKTLGAGGSSPTITVSGYTATLNVAQTAPNMGVGDFITYTGGSCYLSGKTSTTVWSCQNATGGTAPQVSGVTVTSIAHAFSSLEGAVDGNVSTSAKDSSHLNTLDLQTNNYVLNVPCYSDNTGVGDTTPVLVRSWTTSQPNYIKIYTPTNTVTEANASQRHQGKYDTSKYRLEVSDANLILDYANYLRIEGIQFQLTTSAGWGIIVLSAVDYDKSGSIYISSNILKGNLSGSANTVRGISVYNALANPTVYIYNNVAYDLINGSNQDINFITANSGSAYAYNNTIYNCRAGFVSSTGIKTFLVKNNIAEVMTDGYVNSFNAASDYNISNFANDAPSPSYRNNLATTINFSDSSNYDFHLGIGDTAARNTGMDLGTSSTEPYLVISTDIDGHTRGNQGGWDIGADEGAAAIFYSVGQSTAPDLKVGSPTVTISGYNLTFGTAQTGNIGVGDIVTYTGGSCFISGKSSYTNWNCQNATGGTAPQVSGVSVTSIKRAFGSLEAAVDANFSTSAKNSSFLNTTDLYTNNYQLNIPCYYDSGPDMTAVNLRSWTTARPNYIKLYTPTSTSTEANYSQRHQGKWDATRYSLQVGNSRALLVQDGYVRVDGIQILTTSTNADSQTTLMFVFGANTGGVDYYISDNIVRGYNSNAYRYHNGIDVYNTGNGGNVRIWNNIIYGYTGCVESCKGLYLESPNSNISFFIYNNTVYNSNFGYVADAPINDPVLKNNIAQNTSTGFNNQFDTSNSANNLSDHADAPGSNPQNSKTVTFADVSNYDFHLDVGDTAARGAGMSLGTSSTEPNFKFDTDIDGHTRTVSDGWDIGADQGAHFAYYSVGQNTADLRSSTAPTTVTIDSSSNATIDVAQTGNIGTGDYIEYGTAPYVKAYISAKGADNQHWKVTTVTGGSVGTGTTMPVNSIKHAFTTMNGAVAGASGANYLNTTDLYTNNLVLNIPCYYDSAADTTAVTVSGYTTATPNYIKLYTPSNTSTEANYSQRHQGKWDDSRYSLRTTNGYTVNVGSLDVKLIGLQIKTTVSSSGYSFGLSQPNGSRGTIDISGNITMASIATGATTSFGIASYHSASTPFTANVYNNIFYGFKNQSASSFGGISLNAPNATMYSYNNTVYGSYYGFTAASGSHISKNNLAQNNTVDFNSGFNSASTNNVSSDASAPGYNTYYRNKTVQFVDAPHNDFHLAASDTAARNAGADLSTDAQLSVSTDIDGHTRGNLGGWDIGADEGAAYIYYSVGQNTSDHKTGLPNITVSGYNATLSVGQTAPNMGVGDLITYTGGSCFISGKTDNQHWNCQNATGGTAPQVSGVSVTSIAHAFSSLVSATDGNVAGNASHLNNKDLYTGNFVLNLPCYYDTGADSSQIAITNWTNTGINNYMRIYTPTDISTETNSNQRASGKWDDSKFRSETADIQVLVPYINYLRIEGIQFKMTLTNTGHTIIDLGSIDSGRGGEIIIKNNIFAGNFSVSSTSGYAVGAYQALAMPTIKVSNNIFYGFINGANTSFAALTINTAGSSMYAYNNTVVNSYYGFMRSSTSNFVAKNNISQNNNVDYSGTMDSSSTNNIAGSSPQYGAFGTSADSGTTTSTVSGKLVQSGKHFTQTVKVGMIVKNTTDSTYTYVTAIDSDTQLSVASGVPTGKAYTIYTNRYGTVSFADATNKDFHLKMTDTTAKNQGVSLASDTNLWFNTDIDGEARTGSWSIGADEPSGATAQYAADINQNATAGLDNGLVGYWSFNGDDVNSTTAFDRSGKNNNGTILAGSAPTPSIGARGQGMSFNGNSSIKIPYNSVLFSTATTVSFWAKSNVTNYSSNAYPVAMYDYIANKRVWGVYIDNSTTGKWSVISSSNGGNSSGQSSGQNIQSGWHYITVTTSDAGYHWSYYYDGNNIATLTTTTYPFADQNSFLTIGGLDSSNYFNGSLDEVRIYNRALSSSEIGNLYRLGGEKINHSDAGTNTNGLVGHWTFDGGNITAGTALDSSGQNNSGQISGATRTIGKLGQAMNFNGSSSYIGLPTIPSLTAPYSISVWFKPALLNADQDILAFRGSNGYPMFRLASNNKLLIYAGAGKYKYGTKTFSSADLNQWWHAIFVVADANDLTNWKVYLNGSDNTGTAGPNTGSYYDPGTPGRIGDSYYGGANGYYFSGAIDDVRIYNRALSPAEAGDLYRVGHVKISK